MPSLSVVVVVYNMPRAAPRTLFSLSAQYQQHIDPDDYEVIVVDNASSPPVGPRLTAGLSGNFRVIRVDHALQSPAHAVNVGIAAARGEVIGVLIDGARMVTPGLLRFALVGTRSHPRAIVASMGWYLGADYQTEAMEAGYDEAHEDALLASIDWPADGYRLFEISTMDESSVDGWTTPIAETNTLFLRRELWDELGGMDERFGTPGGGLVNLDTYRRAVNLEGAERVVLLGEGSFHQIHGGISTNAPVSRQSSNWNAWHVEYQRIRGQDFDHEPYRHPPVLIGTLPPPALSRFVRSAAEPAQPASQPRDSAQPDEPTAAALITLAHREIDAGRFGAAGAVLRLARHRHPRHREVERLLSITAHAARNHPVDAHRAVAVAEAHRLLGNLEAAGASYRAALAHEPNFVQAHLGLSVLRMPADHYFDWLQWLYDLLAPATAIEIGVYQGQSLALHRPPTVAIGIDPEPRVIQPLRTETHIFTETSDAFFARRHGEAILAGRPVSVGFIDGLHRYEQVLRDFINLESCCGPESVILLHDTLPLDELTQRRERQTQFHTGDVWRAVLCLKQHRPDLDVFTIPTPPAGLTVVSGLNPRSRVLDNGYDKHVAEFLAVSYERIADDMARAFNIIPAEFIEVRRRLTRRLRR